MDPYRSTKIKVASILDYHMLSKVSLLLSHRHINFFQLYSIELEYILYSPSQRKSQAGNDSASKYFQGGHHNYSQESGEIKRCTEESLCVFSASGSDSITNRFSLTRTFMDPITAIGLAANILQFIDYGAKVVTGAIEIYGSASGNTQESRNSETIVTEMRLFAAKLQPPENGQLSGEERALCKLATECQSLAKQILDLLEKIKPKSRKSKGSSLIAGLKTKMYEGERRRLGLQLSNCRAQSDLQLNYLTR
jgi:hypothetical protein